MIDHTANVTKDSGSEVELIVRVDGEDLNLCAKDEWLTEEDGKLMFRANGAEVSLTVPPEDLTLLAENPARVDR
ncbi:MAG: hypothetical protein ACYSUV_02090 [Planctomycetota bacterium]|jgi:hypothetical protein